MKKRIIELKWGVLFTLSAMMWMYLEKWVGLHNTHIDKHPIYTNLFAIVAIGIYVLALLDKRKRSYKGIMNWKQGFVTGLIISVVITLLTPLSQIITATVITPEYFRNAITFAVQTGKMDQAAAEAYFNLSNYILQSTLFAPVMGLLTSAVVAIFTRQSTGK
jgi:hypothetical protein